MKVTLTFTDCTISEAAHLVHCAEDKVAGFEGFDATDFATACASIKASAHPEEVHPDDREEANISGLDDHAPPPVAPPPPAPRKRPSRAKVPQVPPPAPAIPVPPPAPAIPVPPPPPQNFNAAELVETFPQFMLHITPRLASGELTTAKLKLVTDTLGLEGLGSLATQTNLIGRAMDLLK